MRNFPLFLIDRSKSKSYPFDYVACFDEEAGFVAKVLFVAEADKEPEDYRRFVYPCRNGAFVLQIESFLFDFEPTEEAQQRVKTLLKKAIKKYVHEK